MYPRIFVQMSTFPDYVWEIVEQDGTLIKKFKTNESLQKWWAADGHSLNRLTKMMRKYMKAINANSAHI